MKRTLALIPLFFLLFQATAQKTRFKPNKYPSLFWEITGNGLKKPSYLFGTMHVSNKMAFFLSDSFYIAIRRAEVVALENNPELWQQEIDDYGTPEANPYAAYRLRGGFTEMPSTAITEHTLQFDRYEKMLEQALYVQPFILNSLLYRKSYAQAIDFEEDTYLDLYIFQTGKKLGKRVTGVEQYAESMRLVMEASVDAMNEKNKLQKSYDFDPDLSEMKLQEAYRSGNLDWLDTIHKANSESPAYDEKFIYKRNEIQARSIDSILRKNTLFVGVGAAHLPGDRGVIELLRRMGYKLRPIFMTRRDNIQKDAIDKIRVPVKFHTEKSSDGFFSVDVPGKLYSYDKDDVFSQSHFADMSNGSFYMVTRVLTHHRIWGDTEKDVLRKTDSVLYENIPGKILSRQPVERNGYKGWDIVNRTRSGDVQRSQVFVTPFELVIFKISGRGDYIQKGEEAKHFFESIRMKEFAPGSGLSWQPRFGGFKADFPHEPFVSVNGKLFYDAVDKTTGALYSVQQFELTNFEYPGEDAFDLQLLKESFATSDFVDTVLYSSPATQSGYPALDALFRDKQGYLIRTRFIIRGPNGYLVLNREAPTSNERAPGKPAYSAASERFFQSFSLLPFDYGNKPQWVDDSLLNLRVLTPWFPEMKKKGIHLPADYGRKSDDEYALNEFGRNEMEIRLFSNDTTGEAVFVGFSRFARYKYSADSSEFELEDSPWGFSDSKDSLRKVRYRKDLMGLDGSRTTIWHMSDSGSSRMLRMKFRYKNGSFIVVISEGDTLSAPSSFVSAFFDQLVPADTAKGYNPFVKKSALFFGDLFSQDTLVRQKALASLDELKFDSADLPGVIKSVRSLSWKDKKYLPVKSAFISKLSDISTRAASDFLYQSYFEVGDTILFQHVILNTLLKQQTSYSYDQFRNIIKREPPILETAGGDEIDYSNDWDDEEYDNFLDRLEDSLALTKSIFPDLLPLVNLEDYRKPIMGLLETLIDSNQVSLADYQTYFSKFFLEARHSIRKQMVAEKQKAINKASKEVNEEDDVNYLSYPYDGNRDDEGNKELSRYASILAPAWDTNADVRHFFDQLLSSNDQLLRYRTMGLLLRHGKKIPDTLLDYFAGQEEYRFRLFLMLKHLRKDKLFPGKGLTQETMARSLLLYASDNEKPDSLVFLRKHWMETRVDTGYLYVYKYKSKKDDAGWKLATVGLFSKDSLNFDLLPDRSKDFYYTPNPFGLFTVYYPGFRSLTRYTENDYTEFWDTRLEEDKTLDELIRERVKRIYYGQHKSSVGFFQDQNYLYNYFK